MTTTETTSKILKKVPREDEFARMARERNLAGKYRVIHGTIEIPLPRDKWTDAEGKDIPGAPKTDTAREGDELLLSNEDAARMLDADIVEPIDAKPSRVGKVWAPPVTKRNPNVNGSSEVHPGAQTRGRKAS